MAEVTSQIRHDIRSLIMSLQANIALLKIAKKNNTFDKYDEYLERLERQVKELSNMILPVLESK